MLEFLDANLIGLLNGLARGMLLFMLASGLSLIFGTMNVLNLAHGAFFLVGGYLAAQFATPSTFWLLAGLAVVVGLSMGLLLRVLVEPLRGRGHLAQALVTLGLAFVIRDGVAQIWGRDFKTADPPPPFDGSVLVFGHDYPSYRLLLVVIGVVLVVAMYFLFERTTLGAMVRATVEDAEMASAVGIDVKGLQTGVMAAGCALAVLAGYLGAPLLSVFPGLDDQVLLAALIVVVVGGLGSLGGALVGALLVGQIETTGVAAFPQLTGFLTFGMMAFVLLARPEGLFGRKPS